MRKFYLLGSALLACAVGWAQRTPLHPLDIQTSDFDQLVSNFNAWKTGKTFGGVSKIDEQFFISRQRPLERIAGSLDYKADGEGDENRNLCLWVPLDDPTVTWKALPRYCFEGDNFSNWSYVTIHGNWTAPWLRVTAGLADVAHKNGVKVGCVMSVPWAQFVEVGSGANTYSAVFSMLCEKDNDGNFKNTEKFVKFLKYYGIDGVGVNSEFSSDANSMENIRNFFAECHTKAKEIGWNFQLHWYDGTNDYGSIQFDQGLNSNNALMFGSSKKVVTDMMFANYNWNKSVLTRSEQKAEELGRSSYDYYAGFDIQGRALRNLRWNDLLASKISIGFWGAHKQSLIHQSATDNGTSDVAIQKTYLDKQELIFSGGNRNPANTPSINMMCDLSNASLQNFHGLSRFLSAKSTIQAVPFVSRFNLGNGLVFRNDGQVAFNHKWHNIATQDIMPTWRWWIVDGSESAKNGGLVNADLTWNDSWFGGSCLQLSGQTALSRVKLFKTALTTQPTYNISVTYKVPSDTKTHAKLFVALKDKLTDYKEIDIPEAKTYGQWQTFTTTLGELGLSADDVISMIGITVAGAPADYKMYVGEIAVRDPQKSFAPVAPEINEVEIIRGKGSSVDFKMRYSAKDESDGSKYYNDEVDTWYYEIFMQQENRPVQLLTATTSWAAYVVDAPLKSGFEGRNARFGVVAVSPDGLQKSDTTWTAYKQVPYDTPSTEVVIDMPVIKPGQSFTMSLEDEMAQPAQKWQLVNSQTGTVVYTAENTTKITTKIDEVGTYDLILTPSSGANIITRGKVVISPKATGKVPEIIDFAVDKHEVETGKDVTYNYTIDKGEGKVSRALTINDPDMLMIPGEMQVGKTYTYALWVKANKYAHDSQGTNLISKNTIADRWPHNNWGDLWVQVRPACTADAGSGWYGGDNNGSQHTENEVSFNTFGWLHHDSPWEEMMSTGYSLNPGVWNHIAVTQKGNQQAIFFNGKRVAYAEASSNNSRRENSSDARIDKSATANIFIGGGGVYKAGFNGWVDEVQVWNKALTEAEVLQAMQGYKAEEVPEGLQAYYTFETYNTADSTFANYGHGGEQYKARMVRTQGSGGEATGNAAYVTQEADNSTQGYPGIEGTMEIKATRTFSSPMTTISSEDDKAAVVKYNAAGTYSATLNVTNDWASDERTLEDAVIVSVPTSINAMSQESDLAIYPNPFVESVNFRFAEAGHYTVSIINAAGTVMQTNSFNAQAGKVISVTVTAPEGLYLVQVVKDGKVHKTVKVVKK